MQSYACSFVPMTQKKKEFLPGTRDQHKIIGFLFPSSGRKVKNTFVPCRAMLSLAQCVCGLDAVLSNDRYELYAVAKCMSIVFIQRLEEC